MNVTWTNRGEVDTIFDPVSGVTFDYEWTASSLVDSVTAGTGLARDYSYDTAGRVTADVLSNTAGVVSTMGYGYDTGSNMVTKVVGIPGNPGFGTHTYTYDQADRLESWAFGTETTAYGYDLSGNRTQAGTDIYSFDARNRLITGPEGAYSHTARGTLVSVIGAETHTYDFDSLDRLVAFDAVNYTYDGLDRVATRGTDTFTYSGLGIDPTSDGQFTYGRTPGGNLLSITDGTETVLVGRDRHGDVTHLYDQTGVIQHSRLYDPFGEVTTTAGTQVGQVGFQGDWTDPASEHVWMGARWYDGGWATFLSRDTVFGELSTSVSLNRYTYAYNNPLSFWDPDGRCPDYLGSINGGSALAQCKAGQAEMTVRMQAQSQTTQKSSGRRSSLSFEGMFDRMISALTSPAKTPEPASATVREAAAPPGHLWPGPWGYQWRPDRSFGDQMRGGVTGLLNLGVGATDALVLAPASLLANASRISSPDGIKGLAVALGGGGWDGVFQYDFTVGPVDPFGTEHTAGVAERSHQAGEIIGAVAGLTALAKTGVTKISSLIKGNKATSLADDIARAADDVGSLGANGTDDIAVIGRQADTAVAQDWAGHEVLNLPADEWSLARNDRWVQSVVERKMDVYVGSNPSWGNLWDATNARPTVFGRELQQFTEAGYSWDGWYLRAPGGR